MKNENMKMKMKFFFIGGLYFDKFDYNYLHDWSN